MDTIRDKKLLEENLKILKDNEKKYWLRGALDFGFHLLKTKSFELYSFH